MAVRLSPWINRLFCKGSWVQSSATSIFFSFFFSRFFLIPSQRASLYIIASFEVYLIDENNYPHVLVVLFQKSYTCAKHIDMPLLYSISSPKSMTDMRGSSNFRLSWGGGGGGEDRIWQKKALSTFWPWNLYLLSLNPNKSC